LFINLFSWKNPKKKYWSCGK